MIRLLEIGVALVFMCVLGIIVGAMLPDHQRVERTVQVSHPVRLVYDTLNGYRTYRDWTALTSYDPAVKLTSEGKDFGVGARIKWQSDKTNIGTGSLEIVESTQDRQIVMALTNPWKGENKKYTIKLEPDAKSKGKVLKITWTYDVHYGWDLIGRYSGLYVHGEPDTQIQMHLSKLANLVATYPMVDYSSGLQLGLPEPPVISIVDVTSTPALMISTKSERNIESFNEASSKALETLQAFMKKEKMDRTGTTQIVTTAWAEQNYEFDVIVPVAQDISPPDGIKIGTTYGGKALNLIVEKNSLAVLDVAQKMLKAYAYTHGYAFDESVEGNGRFFDEPIAPETTTSPPASAPVPANNETASTEKPPQKVNVYLPIQL